jgi:glycosyltransferase involved in cell wall biosynthesis
MKIAIMMRAMDQDSGFRAYVEGLLDALLRLDHINAYLLLYRTPKWLGRFAAVGNVHEVLVKAPHTLIWDQLAVPYAAYRAGADVLFNPKFSVPLLSPCPVAMGLQEPAWWAWPEHYAWWDVRYIRTMLPLYCRKAAHLFPMSQFVLDENRKYLGLPLPHATVTYPAPQASFRPMDDRSTLEACRRTYRLPPRFILSVTRVDHMGVETAGLWCPGKNVETTLRAFARCRDQIPHDLVVAGRHVRDYLRQMGWSDGDLVRVHFLGFVPHDALPALYNLADLFVIPSFYEGFGFALVEALASGCAVVASHTGACPEVSSGAALLADPHDPADFAGKMLAVLGDEALRQELQRKSLARARVFNWDSAARLTLHALVAVATQAGKRGRALEGVGKARAH